MSEAGRDVVATRSALRELEDERRVVDEGRELLDQKRMLLATEILRRLDRFEEHRARFTGRLEEAREALEAAIARHGVEGLLVQPAAEAEDATVQTWRDAFLGVGVVDAHGEVPAAELPWRPPNPSPEVRRCAEVFRALLEAAPVLAAMQVSLERLREEYARTERRARALDDVLLPELDRTIARIGEQLEELEREDAVRVRWWRRRRAPRH